MKKSAIKVFELFVYALLVILALLFAMHRGGLYAPVNLFPAPAPVERPAIAPAQETEKPLYSPPPKGALSR